ncbi:MAG TPA: glycosyltransferase [Gemmataceae bacterium]|nr:glycosyltransferase [Gemmataceae bacterium]
MTRESLWRRLTRGARRFFERPEWPVFAGTDWADRIMGVTVTDHFNSKQGRSTGRWVLHTEEGRLTVYLKRHYDLPRWRGVMAVVWPNRGWSPAVQEWHHLQWAREQGLLVPRPVAAAEFIGPWGRLQSFLAVEELAGMLPLNEAVPLAARHYDAQTFTQWKRGLIAELARVAHSLHDRRHFHKDLYLCHFFIPRACLTGIPDWRGRVHLIDLHRLGRHRVSWPIWQTKDLAQLLYSSEVEGIDLRDRLRFWRDYWGLRRHHRFVRLMKRWVRFKWGRYRRHNLKKKGMLEAVRKRAGYVEPPLKLVPAAAEGERHIRSAPVTRIKIGLCYDSVLPARGGCETYISDLSRRLVADKHEVHLFACRWDAASLPPELHYHALHIKRGPRFLRPWRFARACEHALRRNPELVSIGFDKTWDQDVLYPQGGLHAATAEYNLRKYGSRLVHVVARVGKWLDLAHWSYLLLEHRQYLGTRKPLIVVNSNLVVRHFEHYYGIKAGELRVVRSAIDPERFAGQDRLRRRLQWRQEWGLEPDDTAGLFVAMNYRLKGLEPLLRAVCLVPRDRRFQLLVAGNPRTSYFESLARRLGISDRVRFLGPRRDVQNCYFAADFLVHPTFYDPCSLVVLEAIACGLPVITTRYNGAGEILNPPHDGYVIYDPHDHQQLADCMTQFLDPALRSACARAARQTAASWTFEHHYQQLMSVLVEAARRKCAA